MQAGDQKGTVHDDSSTPSRVHERSSGDLMAGLGEQLRAVGWVLKAGRRLHFCEAEVWCDDVLIAKATATMAVVEVPPAAQPQA